MSVFDCVDFAGHEEVRFICEEPSGLKAVIAVHNSFRGPALGGIRMRPYGTEAEAARDAIRLSHGMARKSAILKMEYGGAKAVIIGDPRRQKTEALLEDMGRAIERFAGRWYTGEDAGITEGDIEVMRRHTQFALGSRGGGGDPSPFTSLGVFHGLRAAATHKLGCDDLKGVHVAVQGTGAVGGWLCHYLHQAGAILTIADVSRERVTETAAKTGANVVDPDAIYAVEADVFAPCAFGMTINKNTIPLIKAPIIAGGANNQLEKLEDSDELLNRGITYAPDYLINSAGLMNIVAEAGMRFENETYNAEAVKEKAATIYDRTLEVLKRADIEGASSARVANAMADEWIESGRPSHI